MILKAAKEDEATRLDRFIARKTGVTRSRFKGIFDSGLVTVNGKTARAGYRVRAGDEISFDEPPYEKGLAELTAEDIPINILYRDEDIAVVDKPPGMVVYPAAGHSSGTLMNVLKFHIGRLAPIGGAHRPGVVHRLDKDTSGVMVVALSEKAYYGLIEQFRGRTINRNYIALVFGNPKGDRGEISLAVGRSDSDRKKMSTKSRRSKSALTTWEVIERFDGATLIKARLATGRTHQIRVHFSAIGHPVMGDKTYGKKLSIIVNETKTENKRPFSFPRQMLHAETLGFVHPATGKRLEFKTPLPEDMKEAIKSLRGIDSQARRG